jgi:hypothetical protein
MKMIKLTEEHYILVDDSEIKIGDIVSEKLLTGEYELFEIHTLNDIDKVRQKKVTHSNQPLGKPLFFTNAFESELSLSVNGLNDTVIENWGCKKLSLSEVKELLGVVDVEKKAEKWHNSVDSTYPDVWNRRKESYKAAFESGYYQALEDNKEKKYTEEDVIKMIEKSRTTGLTAEYLILAHQPQTEWEVEFIDGKLKLKS